MDKNKLIAGTSIAAALILLNHSENELEADGLNDRDFDDFLDEIDPPSSGGSDNSEIPDINNPGNSGDSSSDDEDETLTEDEIIIQSVNEFLLSENDYGRLNIGDGSSLILVNKFKYDLLNITKHLSSNINPSFMTAGQIAYQGQTAHYSYETLPLLTKLNEHSIREELIDSINTHMVTFFNTVLSMNNSRILLNLSGLRNKVDNHLLNNFKLVLGYFDGANFTFESDADFLVESNVLTNTVDYNAPGVVLAKGHGNGFDWQEIGYNLYPVTNGVNWRTTVTYGDDIDGYIKGDLNLYPLGHFHGYKRIRHMRRFMEGAPHGDQPLSNSITTNPYPNARWVKRSAETIGSMKAFDIFSSITKVSSDIATGIDSNMLITPSGIKRQVDKNDFLVIKPNLDRINFCFMIRVR